MNSEPTKPLNTYTRLGHRAASSEASQLVEFALALPLLVVLVVGIFDFGAALNLKHQLGNIADDAARLGASQPMSDLTGSISPPDTITSIVNMIRAELDASLINDCGLANATGSAYSWTAQGTGCAAVFTVTIERAYMFQTASPNSVDIVCTHIKMTYPYKWLFNSVIQLLVPGAAYGATLPVGAETFLPNMW
jgi:Flp pilus assembly protein TadG